MSESILIATSVRNNGDANYHVILDFDAEVPPRFEGLVSISDFTRKELASRIPATASVPYRIVPNFLADPGPRDAVDPAGLRG